MNFEEYLFLKVVSFHAFFKVFQYLFQVSVTLFNSLSNGDLVLDHCTIIHPLGFESGRLIEEEGLPRSVIALNGLDVDLRSRLSALEEFDLHDRLRLETSHLVTLLRVVDFIRLNSYSNMLWLLGLP